MTTAKKLQVKGWKRDQPWIEEVRVPEALPWDQTGRINKLPVSQWAEWGVTNRDGSALADNGLSAGLMLPMGRKGPAFLTYDNFDIYIEWNQSITYALTASDGTARKTFAQNSTGAIHAEGSDVSLVWQPAHTIPMEDAA